MKTEELKNNFEQTVTVWEKALNNYSNAHLLVKENEENWSVGQVYEHLISISNRILGLVKRLNSQDDYNYEVKTEKGVIAFEENTLGIEKLKLPADNKNQPAQQENKVLLLKELALLKTRYSELCDATSVSVHNGKYQHTYLGFLNAIEWLQFIEMHFRHHLRQKERIDNFIKTQNLVN